MDSDKPSTSHPARDTQRPHVLVGKSVTVRSNDPAPDYFTNVHHQWVGKSGRVHAIVATRPRDNPLVKVGFDEGTQIVFFRLSDLEVLCDAPPEHPRKHGARGSHLPE